MPPVDISLVRRINQRTAIRTEHGMFHFEVTRRQQRSRSAANRHGVKMQPSIELAGKDDPLAHCPEKLVFHCESAKVAALSGCRLPDLTALSRLRVCNANRPGQRSGAMGSKLIVVVPGSAADKGDPVALRRPHRGS